MIINHYVLKFGRMTKSIKTIYPEIVVIGVILILIKLVHRTYLKLKLLQN